MLTQQIANETQTKGKVLDEIATGEIDAPAIGGLGHRSLYAMESLDSAYFARERSCINGLS